MPLGLDTLAWLVVLPTSWLLGGAALVRGALGARGRVESASLALAAGLLAHVLAVNALARVVPFRLAAGLVVGGLLAGGIAARASSRHGRRTPLAWEVGRGARTGLLGLAVAGGCGALLFGLGEIFADDGAHAAIAALMLADHFPPRSPCNPDVRLAYHYGGSLLAASVKARGGLWLWHAIDVARALGVSATLPLAFLTGWRPRRSVAAGLLSVALLVTAGQATWIVWPLLEGPAAAWALSRPELAPQVSGLRELAATPYGLVAPGNAPSYAHAHRSLAWGFAPLLVLLFLALLETELPRRAKTLALGSVLGAADIMQAGVLAILWPALAACGAWEAWRRRRPPPAVVARGEPSGASGAEHHTRGFSFGGVAALALALAIAQGGPVADGFAARLEGASSAATSLSFAPLQLPSCRGAAPTLGCLLRSLLDVGFVACLWPWLAWRAWRARQGARLGVVAGCLVAAAVPLLFRYEYDDWSILRTLTFSVWTLAVLLGPRLQESGRASRGRAALAGVALVLLCASGAAFLVARATWVKPRDPKLRNTTALFGIAAHDEALAPLGARLPRDARVFDPAGCQRGLAPRPSILFGRYAPSARERVSAAAPTPGFLEVRSDPDPQRLRRNGYTHVYLDAEWTRELAPEARARLRRGPFALLGFSGGADDFRALLRVCAPREGCALRLPAPALDSAPAP